MIRRLLFPLVLGATLLTSGCYTVTIQAQSANPVLVNQGKPGGRYFSAEERVGYLLFGLVNLNPDAAQNLIRSHKVGRLRNITITTEEDMLGIVLRTLTFQLYGQRVIKIEGHAD